MTNPAPTDTDYRQTLFLPKTSFPMRAGLPKTEQEWLKIWAKQDLYKRLRKASKGRPSFVLHDGPPYANGHIHAGTALNKILKDMITRSKQMTGFDANYIPGWDCHGLPIEWQVEEAFRREGKIDTIKPQDFRAACRAYASEQINIQREEFKRLGVMGDWDNPYLTMDYASEAAIVREFLTIAMSGRVVCGVKPVMWSSVEQTALAEAELEYADRKVPTVWVRFKLPATAPEALKSASVLIWTTTPWTLPANQAVAYGPDIEYAVFEVEAVMSESELGFAPYAQIGERVILAQNLAEAVMAAGKVVQYRRIDTIDPASIKALHHPFCTLDEGESLFGETVPLLAGHHVSDEAGTGFVHTAPAHGDEDYALWQQYKSDTPIRSLIDPAGRYAHKNLPTRFAGLEVIRTTGKKRGQDGPANAAIIAALAECHGLFARGITSVRDAHSWRSRAPVIRRATPQWFISMDKSVSGQASLRDSALQAIDTTHFIPERGRNRLRSMVTDRPDWLVSRQRQWGTPITLFVHRESGEMLRDAAVNARIVEAIEQGGSDAWFTIPAQDLLGETYRASDYEKVTDILDVWFDSGSTHAFALEDRGLSWPADLYLEGSDQHRGWFQSSLLQACATRGKAPYRAVLTHGFVVDAKGRKMSKSLGNTISPEDIAKQYGAEILRVWAAASDYTDDPGIGDEIIAIHTESYRRLRNTLRYLLGALNGYPRPSQPLDLHAMPGLERYILHRLVEMNALVRKSYDAFDFQRGFHALVNFCVNDLSSLYFDIRKDSLYCDPLTEPRRQACLSVMATLFDCLSAWLAPILAFTCEEAWQVRMGEGHGSVHERLFPDLPEAWLDPELAQRWQRILRVRKVVTGALERERTEQQPGKERIGSSLEAAPLVYLSDAQDLAAFDSEQAEDIFITSAASLHMGHAPGEAFTLPDIAGIEVVPERAKGKRCARSWKRFDSSAADIEYPDITPRDAKAVRAWKTNQAEQDAQ